MINMMFDKTDYAQYICTLDAKGLGSHWII